MSDSSNELNRLDRLIESRQYADALQLGRKLSRKMPAEARVWLSLSEACRRLARFEESVASSGQAHELQPRQPFTIAQHARCLLPGADYAAITPLLEAGLRHHGNVSWAMETLASCAVGIDHWSMAREYYRLLLQHDARRAHYHHMLAVAHTVLGDTGAALEHLDSAITLDPSHGPAYWSLMDVAPDRVERRVVEAFCASEQLDEARKLYFFQVLGQINQREQRHAEAFDCYLQANRIKRRRQPYQPEDDVLFMRALAGHWQELPARASEGARAPSGPVFIVGLPRSGSTLVEQLLVDSGMIEAPGELRDFRVLMGQALGKAPVETLNAADLRKLDSVDLKELGERYLERVRARLQEQRRFIDKNPFNFLFTGILLAALPDARIIHVRKNPLDACLGNYRHLFAAAAPYSCDLDDLAVYYRAYHELMEHWEAVCGDRLLRVDYEALVRSPEAGIDRLYRFCGLPRRGGEGRQARQRRVSSASAVQAREPIHDRALHGWKDFAAQLQPLRDRLRADGIIEDGDGDE